MSPKRTRLDIDTNTIDALEDALSYYMMSSSENFGGGWSQEQEPGTEEEAIVWTRYHVRRFIERLGRARERIE